MNSTPKSLTPSRKAAAWKPRFAIRAILVLTALTALAFSFIVVVANVREAELDQAMLEREAAKRHYYESERSRLKNVAMGSIRIRVIAADTKEPVSGVILETTLIGPDGGDGGFQTSATDADGYGYLHRSVSPGRYQLDLVPNPRSRFADKNWRSGDSYLTILPNGSSSIQLIELKPK